MGLASLIRSLPPRHKEELSTAQRDHLGTQDRQIRLVNAFSWLYLKELKSYMHLQAMSLLWNYRDHKIDINVQCVASPPSKLWPNRNCRDGVWPKKDILAILWAEGEGNPVTNLSSWRGLGDGGMIVGSFVSVPILMVVFSSSVEVFFDERMDQEQ